LPEDPARIEVSIGALPTLADKIAPAWEREVSTRGDLLCVNAQEPTAAQDLLLRQIAL